MYRPSLWTGPNDKGKGKEEKYHSPCRISSVSLQKQACSSSYNIIVGRLVRQCRIEDDMAHTMDVQYTETWYMLWLYGAQDH